VICGVVEIGFRGDGDGFAGAPEAGFGAKYVTGGAGDFGEENPQQCWGLL